MYTNTFNFSKDEIIKFIRFDQRIPSRAMYDDILRAEEAYQKYGKLAITSFVLYDKEFENYIGVYYLWKKYNLIVGDAIRNSIKKEYYKMALFLLENTKNPDYFPDDAGLNENLFIAVENVSDVEVTSSEERKFLLDIIEVLMDKGANPNENTEGISAIDAANTEDEELMQLLQN